MRWLSAVGIAIVVSAASIGGVGCSKTPSEDSCKQLLDHLVDLEFKKAGGQATTAAQKADLAKQKASVVDAKLTAGFMDTCTKQMSKSRVDCALEATDSDTGLAKCDEGK